ncbi:phosphodiesterase [Sedimentitalea sp. JM2-8]|uniref:Phosphodiesterase n=1 Tax=Sedimentitalea xiamensis TaxID=3050037 RepID=A0ABT7FFU3_9RHOB|nr:phosphodiesterase [Sedimentitalea xiamensis]MDK3073694.1 phosphodiesterase [Sedimentitalea xiamensis]
MARFLQLTDLHVVAAGARASGVLDTRAILRTAVERLIDRRAALGHLDAVLVTGDVSDDGTAESYRFARGQLDRLGLPLLAIPGNHDDRAEFRKAFADSPAMPSSGLIDWTTEIGDTVVIGLDTLVEGQGGGALRPESLAFLSEALARAGSRPVVVAVHHPPLRTGIRFMDAIGLEDIPALQATLAQAGGEIIVVAGHVHGVFQGRIGRHPVATAPAVSSAFALDLRPDAPVGFMTGPTGCAVFDTGPDGVWAAVPLEIASGPFPFQEIPMTVR